MDGQVKSLAAQPWLIDALPRLSATIGQLDDGLDADALEQARTELGRYYLGDFDTEYRKQVSSRDSGIRGALQRLDAPAVMAQLHYVQRNPFPLGQKVKLVDAKDGSDYSSEHARIHAGLVSVQQSFGFYDVFVIDDSGRIVYSVFKELDFATSLANGPWTATNLGQLFASLRGTPAGQTKLADFALYTPSYDGPAAFLGTPVEVDGKRLGYVAVQLPIDRINQVATATTGMGRSGEVTLVGPDFLMRSDSRHNPDTHNVVASFRNPSQGRCELDCIKAALAGQSGSGNLVNVDGKEETAVWLPLEVLGTRWAMLAKVEQDEIFAGVGTLQQHAAAASNSLLWWSVVMVIAVAFGVAFFSWFFARHLTTPIHRTVAALRDIAEGEGDLRARLDESRPDELGEMGSWFNRFLTKLQGTVSAIATKANSVSAAAAQLTSTAQLLAEGAERTKSQTNQAAAAAEEMAANMKSVSGTSEAMTGTFRTVAAAVEQMTASIGEVAKSANNAAQIAGSAAQLTRSSNEKVTALGAAANEIGRVIETIQDIAEQTNLLALNATIEAARAGEAGKGFSVVANEVKDLARQTAEATQDIRQRIERIQTSTTESVQAIAAIDQVIAQVSQSSQSIATSVSEQRSATQEISSSLAQSARSVESVSQNVNQTVQASQDISRAVAEVDEQTRSTAAGAEETSVAGKAMTDLARELLATVGQFKV
jgi:methyl-accepting chemotaxis protein